MESSSFFVHWRHVFSAPIIYSPFGAMKFESDGLLARCQPGVPATAHRSKTGVLHWRHGSTVNFFTIRGMRHR